MNKQPATDEGAVELTMLFAERWGMPTRDALALLETAPRSSGTGILSQVYENGRRYGASQSAMEAYDLGFLNAESLLRARLPACRLRWALLGMVCGVALAFAVGLAW